MKNMTGCNVKNWACVIETLWATFSSLQPMKTQWENSPRMTVAEKLSPGYYNVERFLIYCQWKVSIVASNKNLWSHMGVKYLFFQLFKKLVTMLSSLFQLWVWSISPYLWWQVYNCAVTYSYSQVIRTGFHTWTASVFLDVRRLLQTRNAINSINLAYMLVCEYERSTWVMRGLVSDLAKQVGFVMIWKLAIPRAQEELSALNVTVESPRRGL